MNKQLTESFKALQTRRALCAAQSEARTAACFKPRVEQAPELTPNQLDRLMHLRLGRDRARQYSIAEVFSKKKKLPLPVFACENTCAVCGVLVEDCRGLENNVFTHRPAIQQRRPEFDEAFDAEDQDAP